jgi:hypothetical protein
VYAREDQSQSFRFENVRVASYPTVLVQPPLSGRYGEPSTVVFQGVYTGDPQKLARDISQAIRQYVSRLQESAVPVRSGYDSLIGIDPPWQPVPRVDPSQPLLRPFPLLPSVDVQIPPQPTPEPASTPVPAFPWAAVVTLLTAGFSLPAAIAVVVWLVFFIRSRRLAAGKQPYVDQATLDRVLELLKRLTDEPKKQSNR